MFVKHKDRLCTKGSVGCLQNQLIYSGLLCFETVFANGLNDRSVSHEKKERMNEKDACVALYIYIYIPKNIEPTDRS